MKVALPPLPCLDGIINLNYLRESLRLGVQKVCQEFDDSAVLFVEESLYEPMLKSYLGTPDKAFEELDLPITHAQPLSGAGMSAATVSQVQQHPKVVFIVKNSPFSAQLVAQYITEIRRLWEKRTARATATAGQPAFWVSVYPEAGQVFHRILSAAGEAACTKTSDLPLHFFPFDRDVLSMHQPHVMKELLTDSNPAALDDTAQALLAFASQHGMPQRIEAVGRHSCIVAELFRRGLRELDAAAAPATLQECTMAKWVVFDRGADLLTPLLSQLTIEGRLDELQNTAPRTGWLAPERHADSDARVAGVRVLLHQTTPKWADWRERHVQSLPDMQAHSVDLEHRRRDAGAAEGWIQANYLRYLQRPLHHLGKDMLDALQPLGTLSEQHASEMQALEQRGRREPLWGGPSSNAPDMLLRLVLAGAPMLTCLRRLLLTVAMRGALPEAAFMECVRILLDTFGAHHVLTLTSLEAAGLLVRRTQQAGPEVASSLASVRMLFDKAEQNQRGNRDSLQLASLLTDAEEAAQDPSATGLPYGRYHPISMLLIRQALLPYNPSWMGKHLKACSLCQGRWPAAADVLASYAVTEHDDTRILLPKKQNRETPLGQQQGAGKKAADETAPQTVLIVMLGGCTHAEMTSLRLALAKKALNMRPVILTTDVITGGRLLASFVPPSATLADADALHTLNTL